MLSWIPSGRADQLMSGVVQACAQIGLLYVRSLPPFSQRGLFVIPAALVLLALSLSSLVFVLFFSFTH